MSSVRTSAPCSSAILGLVAVFDRKLEPFELRLRRRAPAEVLEPLPGGGLDAAFLLLDVRHRRRKRPGWPGPPDASKEHGGTALAPPVRPGSYTRSPWREPKSRRSRLTGVALARSTAIFALRDRRIDGSSGSSGRSSSGGISASRATINVFTVAFQVPNLIRSLVADQALSSAFVPVFSELLERGDRVRAWRVASSVFYLLFLGLGGADRALRPARAVDHASLRLRGRAGGPPRRPVVPPLPDGDPARALRRDRRDPEQLRALHRARR